ncbi:MAG: hypothetical protein R6U96_15320 [Promethearchaeia archaeon]
MQSRKNKKQFLKRIGISAALIGIILVGVMGIFSRFFWIGPRCTTNYFHFNIDYRLGKTEVEDRIIKEPYHKLLQLYEKHPNWDFTVECQAEMIYKIYTNEAYSDIAELTDKLVKRDQMELICGLQFSQLFYSYPADVLELNLKYANETLKNMSSDVNLLEKRSNSLLFQEGQYGYGLATALNSQYAGNIDTVLVSAQQIKDFQKPKYPGEHYPVHTLENPETDKQINLLTYDYLPQWEAGYYHSWNFLLDAELGFEDQNAKEEFTVSDEKLAAYEEELEMLEQEGNEFMKCSDWAKHCKEVDAVGELDYYIPECNWGTTKYNSSYIWAANNGDSTDDGEMLANNYRARQIISATREVYDQYNENLDDGNKTLIEEKFKQAEKLWLQATCTDATGIGPDPIERVTAESNVLTAERNCSQILSILADNFPDELDSPKLQVDLRNGQIFNDSNDFLSLIETQKSLELEDLPLNAEFSSHVTSGKLDPEVNVSLVKYNSSNSDTGNEVYNLTRLDVTFAGSHDWANDSIRSIGIKFSPKEKGKTTKEIEYSPSLLENETKRIYRYNYQYDPLYIFLPLSNGMVFLPNERAGDIGTAIIKNVTQRHTSWLWEYYSIKVLETEGLHMDAHHQFYIIEDIKIEKALHFANRINVHPPWIVSKNTSLIQGNEVYSMYSSMANRLADVGEGSGEWW